MSVRCRGLRPSRASSHLALGVLLGAVLGSVLGAVIAKNHIPVVFPGTAETATRYSADTPDDETDGEHDLVLSSGLLGIVGGAIVGAGGVGLCHGVQRLRARQQT